MGTDVTPADLTKAQARRLTDKIAEAAEHLWTLLLEAHDRKAWKALGYDSFSAYAQTEFGMSERNAFRLLDQGQVIRELERVAELPRASVTSVSARAAEDVKADLPALAEKVTEAVKNVPRAKRPEVVKKIVDEHRAAKAKPAAPSAAELKQELQRLSQPVTQEHYRTLLAWIATAGPAVIAKSCTVEAIKAANEVLVGAHHILRPPTPPAGSVRNPLPPRVPTVQPNFKRGAKT